MTKKDPRAPGAPWVLPYLMSKDAGKAIEFYKNAFGFEILEARTDDDNQVVHAELRYRDQWIMIGQEGVYEECTSVAPATNNVECPIAMCVYVDDVDQFFLKATKHGAKIKFAPDDMPWGDRACNLTDPDGYSWTFCTHTGVPAHQHGEGCCGGH